MKPLAKACTCLALLCSAAGPVHAAHVGVHIAIPLGYYDPFYPYAVPPAYPAYPYPYPYYYPAPVIVTPPSVPYMQAPVAPATPAAPAAPAAPAQPRNSGQDDWYYCERSKSYYPYVKQCPGGWVRVPSRPPQ